MPDATPGRRRSPLPVVQRLPRVGKIRSGHQVEGTRQDGTKYTRPDRLDHFIMVEDASGITSALVATCFHAHYGQKPKSIRVMLAGRTVDEVLQGAYRRYARAGDGGGRLTVACDRNPWVELDSEAQCDYRRRTDGGWEMGQACVCQARGLTGDNACSYSATLMVFLPDVPNATGVVEYETGSVISVRRMTEFLAYAELVRGPGNLLYTEVDLALVPVTVTPAELKGKSSTVYVLQPSLVIPEAQQLDAAPVSTFRGLLEHSSQAPALPPVGTALGELPPDDGYLSLPAPAADEVGDPLVQPSARGEADVQGDRARVLGPAASTLPVTPAAPAEDPQPTPDPDQTPPAVEDTPLVQAVSTLLAQTPEAGKAIIRQAIALDGRQRLTAVAVAEVLGEAARTKPVEAARAYILEHGDQAPVADEVPSPVTPTEPADPSDVDALGLALGLDAARACLLAAAAEYLAVDVQGEGTDGLAAAIKGEFSTDGVWDGEAAVTTLDDALEGDEEFDKVLAAYAEHYGVQLGTDDQGRDLDGEPAPEPTPVGVTVEQVEANLRALPMAAKVKMTAIARDAGTTPHPDKLLEAFGERAGNLERLISDALNAKEAGKFQEWLNAGGGQHVDGYQDDGQGTLT